MIGNYAFTIGSERDSNQLGIFFGGFPEAEYDEVHFLNNGIETNGWTLSEVTLKIGDMTLLENG